MSYDFKSGLESLNANTNKDRCKVKYRDLDHAIQNCIGLLARMRASGEGDLPLVFTKSDLTSAFRILGLKVSNFCWLVLKAEDPRTGKMVFFVDKCLPFGTSISCALFQKFSDVLQFITQYRINGNIYEVLTNYLDDFLFLAASILECNSQVLIFLNICESIGCPVSLEKTEWGTYVIIFFGILLNGIYRYLCVPVDKKNKVLQSLHWFLDHRKATIKQIQALTGLLNFLNKAIVSGRAFTRQIYVKLTLVDSKGRPLWEVHHVKIDKEFKDDCEVWVRFLSNDVEGSALCRLFIDLHQFDMVETLNFYSNASGVIGFGAIMVTFGYMKNGQLNSSVTNQV